MQNKTLETKIESSFFGNLRNAARRNVGKYATIAALAISAAACGSEGPSYECCASINCPTDDNWYDDQICDGEGVDCYCRNKTCCEKASCGYDETCITDGWDGSQCKCIPDPNRDE